VQHNIILTGKAREVFDALKAKVAEIEAKNKPQTIYRTTIITPSTFVFKRVPVVGRVPS
jgi:BMFP domain-containing protein YqiC